MIEIDGSMGEGGGQIVRSSLALSVLTGKPFKVRKIRAGRRRPGLLRQHLTAVKAAARISSAKLNGADLKSPELEFVPKCIAAGEYHFAVGTAGSTALVLQTVLPPLLRADGPSRIVIEGGTHNPFAPPFDYLRETFLPVLERMGARVRVRLDRPGFYPAGGGRIEVEIAPAVRMERIELLHRGDPVRLSASVLIANLPAAIATKERECLCRDLSLESTAVEVVEVKGSPGPGNVIVVRVDDGLRTEVFTGFGEKGTPAPRVVGELAEDVKRHVEATAPVGVYLADQLMIPMAMAGGGSFRTVGISAHASTNAEVIKKFLNVEIDIQRQERGNVLVDIKPSE
ncbi:MAG: RNA 3'-terminal phosphate cyclase [Myxococcota bacterium]